MLDDLRIQEVASSRLDEVDFDDLGFGNIFSDHMFSMRYRDGRWGDAEILPYGPLALEPGTASLHYGQSVFEGLKAFMGVDGRVRIFRPERNAERLRNSCERLCMPMVDEAVFHAALEALIRLDHAWIPRRRGQALYIRPLMFSDEPHLEVRPSQSFRFIVMTAPVRAYFDEDMAAVGLNVEETYTRAAPGGMGSAKTAGNYAASLYPGEIARRNGYAQVLWLDGIEHRYVEEVGAMNIFFCIDDVVVTPELRGTILPGITRESVLTLLEDSGRRVEERRITIDEVVEAMEAGSMNEAFGAGTAAIIAPVGRIGYQGKEYTVNDNAAGPLTASLYERITGLHFGEAADPHGWVRIIDLGENAPRRAAV